MPMMHETEYENQMSANYPDETYDESDETFDENYNIDDVSYR
jgi:hypothetical protein